MNRCEWAKGELDIRYHDEEWGVPTHDDQILFEFLILEGMQAGLSWSLILKRREAMRAAFDNFNPVLISKYTEEKQKELLQNEGIIRNRRKIESLAVNAKSFLQVQQEYGTFDAYIWQFVGGKPIVNHWQNPSQVPAVTAEAEKMSKDLKKKGFKFVGPTICYAFMQATGMVNDHTVDCPWHQRIQDGYERPGEKSRLPE